MLEIARYEGGRRLRSSAAIAVGLAAFGAMFVGMAPGIIEQVDLDKFLDAYPPVLIEAFGIRTLGSLEGFLATELYQFAWVLLFGLYLAYAAGSLVAGDVEHDRMDMLLSNPVSRRSVVLGKFLSLLVPILAANVVVGAVVYVGAVLVGHPIPFLDVVAVHALSVPYLLACASIGLALSVAVNRESLAQRGALVAVFGLFMVESVAASADVELLAMVSPTHYYDPTAILVDGTYDPVGAGVLLATTLALVVASVAWFERKDVP